MYKLYKYENQLYLMALTGAELFGRDLIQGFHVSHDPEGSRHFGQILIWQALR